MRVGTTRFGELEIDLDKIIRFEGGLFGFPTTQRFILLDPGGPGSAPSQGRGWLRWLQSVDDRDLAFVVLDPTFFRPDYELSVEQETLARLELGSTEEGIVLVVATVPETPREITANLKAPILLNPHRRLAQQVILDDPRYSTRHRVLEELARSGKGGGANAGADPQG